MIVLHSTEYYALYPHIVISLENPYVVMPAKHNHTFFGVRLGDHYMPFTKVPLG
jgi:hypothetical protein